MRIAAAQGIAEEVEPDIWSHNEKSLTYVHDLGYWTFKMLIAQDFAMEQLPRYLKTHAIDDIRDLSKSPYAFAHHMEGKSYYEVISADPERIEMFNKALAAMNDQMPVLGMFPFASLKEQVEAEPNRPFIVDIGGGLGRPLMSILGEAPAGFGAQSVLQDRADVINAIPPETVPHVTLMIHDFFTPQPVKSESPQRFPETMLTSELRCPHLLTSSRPSRFLRPSLHRHRQEHRECHGPFQSPTDRGLCCPREGAGWQ